MQHIERVAGRGLIILIVANQATAEVGRENFGRLKVLASKARLPASGRADENHQRKLWNSDVHRLKTPFVWVLRLEGLLLLWAETEPHTQSAQTFGLTSAGTVPVSTQNDGLCGETVPPATYRTSRCTRH